MSRTPHPTPDDLPEPFVGLQPFTENDALFFFGRERERRLLIASMLASRLTLLYGESGAGKSSLLRAGVLHELHEVARRELEEHRFPESIVVFFNSWSDDPVAALTKAIEEVVDELLGEDAPHPPSPTHRLDEVIAAWNQTLDELATTLASQGSVELDLAPRTELLIILDQFEQYFMYHADEDGDGTFAVEFPRAVNRDDIRVSFLISLRADAYARLDQFEGRIVNVFGNNFRIEHLDRAAARRAIKGPIEQLNRTLVVGERRFEIEPELIEAVLDQVEPGSVPLGPVGGGVVDGAGSGEKRVETPYLQLVMTRLWKEESRRWTGSDDSVRSMRLKTLEDLGRAEQIVRSHLDEVMSELSPGERDVAARALNELVTPSGSRNVHKLKDLAGYAKVGEDQVGPILDRLDSWRILRSVDPAPGDRSPRFEIRHDVLAGAVLEWLRSYVESKERVEETKGRVARRPRRRTTVDQRSELAALDVSLATSDLDATRRALLTLSSEGRELLAGEMGSEALERASRSAAQGRRGGKLGKVVVVPGLMGSELDAIDRSGDADRIWLNFVRLTTGRLGDLRLKPGGDPHTPGIQIRTAGVHRKSYMPMLMELDTQWQVRPFAYDWRADIDKSAARLDAEIRAFGAGEPVHLVAHSMGGIVCRRFIQRFPDTWQSTHDASGNGRGGRLIMLGTPNRGFFAIPLMLTGAERMVQMLARADLKHTLEEVVDIFASFPSLYQLLPSPRVDLDDDHKKLFEMATWGRFPVHKALLDRGEALQADLDDVTDPQRLVFVAGYGRPTPFRIRVDAPGRFLYRTTLDGDGRTPHALGLLEGVPTYWVDENHGNLPKNSAVLDSISELLERGDAGVLSETRPPSRGMVKERWLKGEELGALGAEAEATLTGARTESSEDERATVENLTLANYLGSVEQRDFSLPPTVSPPTPPPVPKIGLEVVWGDITKVEGDVYAVGHYEGVLPQRAELALDRVVSGIVDTASSDRRRLIITEHTRQGMVRGMLGDVSFFPWSGEAQAGRLIAVTGMGRFGTFDTAALRRLVSGLVTAVSALPAARTVCTVLIGSGEGGLTIPQAVRGYLEGLSDAVGGLPGESPDPNVAMPLEKLVIVERDRGRAEDIVETLKEEFAARYGHRGAHPLALSFTARLKQGKGGTVSVEESIALIAETLVDASAATKKSPEGRALATLIAKSGPNATVREIAFERLRAEAHDGASLRRPRFRVERRWEASARADIPTRISLWSDGQILRAAAIDADVVVPERIVAVGPDILDNLVQRSIDPPAELVDELSDLLYRLLIPAELRGLLVSGPLVIEVDRSMARVPWEMIGTAAGEGEILPISVRSSVARQLRRTYSPPPVTLPRAGNELRALVVGDPGGPANGEVIPGARSEALKVKDILEARGVLVEARIGAPTATREGLQGIKPADRLEVLSLLLRGGFDVIHYAGAGSLDPMDPTRAGWLFADGVLTMSDIGRVDRVPSLVFANAGPSLTMLGSPYASALLPSVADEFFRFGVRNYVGAAWEVNDVGAELFAETFYEAVLTGYSLAEGVRFARAELWRRRDVFGALWAAYQHYGDPASDFGLGAGA